MNAWAKLFENANWATTVFFIVVILFAAKELTQVIFYFVEKFGVKTKRVLEREKLNKRVENLEKDNLEQKKEIENITNILHRLDKRSLNMELSCMRKEILDMASGLSTTKKYTKEHFNKIFSCYQDYENILEENHMENGQVEVSMQIIREAYKERLSKGEFSE